MQEHKYRLKTRALCYLRRRVTKAISILGSTGSIGESTLSVVRALPERKQVVGLSGGSNVAKLAEQIALFKPKIVSVGNEQALLALGRLVDLSGIRTGFGREAM